MNYFINIYIFLTLLLSLSAFPYSKNFDINSIPIEENSLKNEKKISIPTIKGFINLKKNYFINF